MHQKFKTSFGGSLGYMRLCLRKEKKYLFSLTWFHCVAQAGLKHEIPLPQISRPSLPPTPDTRQHFKHTLIHCHEHFPELTPFLN